LQAVANTVKVHHMELNVTKENLPFCRALLKNAVGFCKALNAEIDLVKKQGATTPEGVKTKKKTAKKATAKKEEKAAVKKEEKAPKKVAKKATAKKATAKKATAKKATAKKATAKKAAKKVVTEGGKRVTLKERVQAYLAANQTSDSLWSPKELLNSDALTGTGNVPLNQVLNQLIEAGEISRVSRGQYKLV